MSGSTSVVTSRINLSGGKLCLEEITTVSFFPKSTKIVIDPSLLVVQDDENGINKSCFSFKKEQLNEIENKLIQLTLEEDPTKALNGPLTRAILLLQLHRLLKSKSSSSKASIEAIVFLSQLLNHDILPLLPSKSIEENVETIDLAASVLLSVLEGKGFALKQDQTTQAVPLDKVLKELSIEVPTCSLSLSEKAAFVHGPVSLLATAALVIAGARGLLPLCDAIAALSCETLKANSAPFEAEYVDASRPHRGIVTVATNLRLMLENSKYINNKDSSLDAACIRYIPQYHGPARDAIMGSFKTIEVEINSFDLISEKIGAFHPQALKTSLASTFDAVQVLLRGSKERLETISSSSSSFSAADDDADADAISMNCCTTITSAYPLTGLSLVDMTSKQLKKELNSCVNFLNTEESYLKAKMEERQQKAQEATKKAAAAALKEDEKLLTMSEEQRIKILEKRRKKLEKQKEKDNSKTFQKDELKIGSGNNLFYQQLKIFDCLNPFDLRPKGLVFWLEELFLRLQNCNGGIRRKPKIAKGAQDFLPHQMALREKIFNKIRMVFKRHAGVEIETPVFELKETLSGKYGEDSKLIYDLADQGGELLALRYDLTVPFARFMALHNPGNIKRFHIARVYRRDNPQMARGRFREFYQCDFDIAGQYASMLPDAEVICIGIEILQQFPELGDHFQIKLSHRLLLDAILSICGVPTEKFRTTCSAIDKLDKEPWEKVYIEMVEEKGLSEEVANKIKQFVCFKGSPRELHTNLTQQKVFGHNQQAKQAMEELKKLFDYLDAMDVLDYISFDLSLARGLDYYTGLIYEFVLTNSEYHVGSIAAGGRYDNLVGMFSATGTQIPCVGVSMGIERIFGILQAHAEKNGDFKKSSRSQVLVASTGNKLLLPRLEICKELWRANISAEIMQVENPKFTKQLHYALEAGIPFMIVIGEDEIAKGEVKIKDMSSKEEIDVKRTEMVKELLKRNCLTTDILSV